MLRTADFITLMSEIFLLPGRNMSEHALSQKPTGLFKEFERSLVVSRCLPSVITAFDTGFLPVVHDRLRPRARALLLIYRSDDVLWMRHSLDTARIGWSTPPGSIERKNNSGLCKSPSCPDSFPRDVSSGRPVCAEG